jgi:hypothetical protein
MYGRYALYGPKSRTRSQTEYFSNLDQFPGSWKVAPTPMLKSLGLTVVEKRDNHPGVVTTNAAVEMSSMRPGRNSRRSAGHTRSTQHLG